MGGTEHMCTCDLTVNGAPWLCSVHPTGDRNAVIVDVNHFDRLVAMEKENAELRAARDLAIENVDRLRLIEARGIEPLSNDEYAEYLKGREETEKLRADRDRWMSAYSKLADKMGCLKADLESADHWIGQLTREVERLKRKVSR